MRVTPRDCMCGCVGRATVAVLPDNWPPLELCNYPSGYGSLSTKQPAILLFRDGHQIAQRLRSSRRTPTPSPENTASTIFACADRWETLQQLPSPYPLPGTAAFPYLPAADVFAASHTRPFSIQPTCPVRQCEFASVSRPHCHVR